MYANDTVQYADVESLVGKRMLIREAVTIEKPLVDIVAYFTGARAGSGDVCAAFVLAWRRII